MKTLPNRRISETVLAYERERSGKRMRAEPLLVMDSRVCGTLKIRAKRGKGETLCLEFEKLEYFFLDIYVVHGMK